MTFPPQSQTIDPIGLQGGELVNVGVFDWLITPAATPPYTPPPGRPDAQTPALFDQKFLLVMSGVVMGSVDPSLPSQSGGGGVANAYENSVVVKGQSNHYWSPVTVHFLPSQLTGGTLFPYLDGSFSGEGPLYYALENYFPPYGTPGLPHGFPEPYSNGPVEWDPVFSVDQGFGAHPHPQTVSYIGLSKIFDASDSVNAGYAVDEWRITLDSTSYGDSYHSYPPDIRKIPNVFTGIEVDINLRDNDAWIMKLGFHITLLGKIALTPTNTPHSVGSGSGI